MKTTTFIAAALASVFAITAAAPSFASTDEVKHEKHAQHGKRIEHMIKRADTDNDNRISPAEMQAAMEKGFDVLDTNHDGKLSKEELDNRRATFKAYRAEQKKDGKHLAGILPLPRGVVRHFDKIDADKDGMISKSDIAGLTERVFKRRDHNKDGYISAEDFKKA